MTTPFFAKDCSLAVIGTGESAQSLSHLRDILYRIPLNSIYHHFWGSRISYHLIHPEYHNDFANWAHYQLHDDFLSERLVILDPTDYPNLEDLRRVIIGIIEDRIDEVEFTVWTRDVGAFNFLRSTIIIFDLAMPANHPSDLKALIPKLPPSSIFYHFIDARKRTPNGIDDFSEWLMSFKEEFAPLIKKIRSIDPFFSPLLEIRQKLSDVFNEQFS